ncbi:hypothetical protein PINS_up023041 [Pythium insidiosum]|nr:hypothetical protein PINS_up023041 [Pythium insidiosum]
MVAAGEATVSIHGSGTEVLKKRVVRGETITSSLPLLASVLTDLGDEETSRELLKKSAGCLSAVASEEHTVIFKIPPSAVIAVLHQYPDSFVRLAQAALSQVEKVTVKSLLDHFGLYTQTHETHPVVQVGEIDRSNPALHEHAVMMIASAFGVTDEASREALRTGSTVVESGEANVVIDEKKTAGSVHVVLHGAANVEILHQNRWVSVCEATGGCQVGLVDSVVGFHLSARITCKPGTIVVAISNSTISKLLQTNSVAVTLISHVLRQYSDLVCLTDSVFESVHLQGGEVLFNRGDVCDAVFTVTSGRLHAIQVHNQRGKTVETTNELVRGATLGAMDMLSAGRSYSTVFAVRDSQISKMPRCVFDYVVKTHPTVLIHFTTNLAQRLSKHGADTANPEHGKMSRKDCFLTLGSVPGGNSSSRSSQLPLGTVAVVSLTKMSTLSTFCVHLHAALNTIGVTDIVSSRKADNIVGGHWSTNSRLARANLSAWLGELESSNDLVIYEGDAQLTAWTKLCMRQADHILLLCSDSEPPQAFLKDMVSMLESAWTRKNVAISVVRIREKDWTLSAVEAATAGLSRASRLRRKLRLWKKSPIMPKFVLPVEKYEWITCFHNVQAPFEDHAADFLRLCRRITGRSVGLVLGGGGARGLAHIGVLRALEECGIHVDVVGGTSIGAFIGAMYALHPHQLNVVRNKIGIFSVSLSSIVEKLKDLTLPIASFFNGTRFNRSIQDHFLDLNIEDLMLNYFCVSTDIAKSRMSVHRSGPVWKYVRASMSLQGYLPPISENGSLLLDGGYMNNLPADVMKEEGGIKYVLAVDVGAEPRHEYFSYGSALSGWWLLWNKLNPFSSTVIVPSMGDVSAALAYVSSEQHKERMKTECIDLYLRPPVNDYGTLEFDKMEEIIQVGYDYALPRVRAWAARVLSLEPEATILEPSLSRQTSTSRLSSTLSGHASDADEEDAELDAEMVDSGESDFEGGFSSS